MDTTDESLLDERKQRLVAQMSRRDDERKTHLQSKPATSTNVGRQTFEQEFPLMRTELEGLFSRLTVNAEENDIQDLADRLQKMEKFITEHVDILRPRDIANARGDVVKLREQLNGVQDRTLSATHRIGFSKTNEDEQGERSKESTVTSSSSTSHVVSTNTISLTNKQNELIRFEPSDLNGKDVAIENLKQCEIFLKGIPSSVQIKNLHACILVVGPCSRSILIDQCHQCEFALACQQLRVHSTTECDFYVHITAQPIIEDCDVLRFAPYNVEYKLKDGHIEKSGLRWTKDYWNDVQDFNHMDIGVPSPHWQLIEEEERKEWSLD